MAIPVDLNERYAAWFPGAVSQPPSAVSLRRLAEAYLGEPVRGVFSSADDSPGAYIANDQFDQRIVVVSLLEPPTVAMTVKPAHLPHGSCTAVTRITVNDKDSAVDVATAIIDGHLPRKTRVVPYVLRRYCGFSDDVAVFDTAEPADLVYAREFLIEAETLVVRRFTIVSSKAGDDTKYRFFIDGRSVGQGFWDGATRKLRTEIESLRPLFDRDRHAAGI